MNFHRGLVILLFKVYISASSCECKNWNKYAITASDQTEGVRSEVHVLDWQLKLFPISSALATVVGSAKLHWVKAASAPSSATKVSARN